MAVVGVPAGTVWGLHWGMTVATTRTHMGRYSSAANPNSTSGTGMMDTSTTPNVIYDLG
jgi:hypothetical protein